MNIQEKQPEALFVFGYMHSGTSLLFNILSSSEDVNAYKKEINFFQRRGIASKNYRLLKTPDEKIEFLKALIEFKGDGISITERDFSVSDNLVKDYFGFWSAISKRYTYYLDGSPNNYLFDKLISQYQPNYKAVAIVRDPRNVIASKKKRWQTTTLLRYEKDELFKKKLEKGYSTGWDSISLTRGIAKLGNISSEKCLIIKYEELVENYDQVIKVICSFLGLDEHKIVKSSEISFSNKADISVKGSGLYKGSAYYSILSPSEIHLIQLFCKKEMKQYGYGFESIRFWDKIVTLKYFFLMGYELVVRLFKRFILLGPKGFINYISLSFKRIK